MSDPSPTPEPERPGPRLRRFTLLDAVALIAAFAVGQRGYMAVMAIYSATSVSSPGQVLWSIQSRGLLTLPYHVLFWFEVAAPMLLSLAATLLVLRRVSPRPEPSRLARQPGAVAISAAFLGAAFVFAAWGLVGYPLLRAGKLVAAGVSLSTQYPVILRVMFFSMVASGALIAGGWGNLLLNGSSSGDSDWIERSGRILGVAWLLATPIYLWAALIIY